jgi:hypothetical protein
MAGDLEITSLFDDEDELSDWNVLVAFNELRHWENIEGSKKVTQTWRMKERVYNITHALFFVTFIFLPYY